MGVARRWSRDEDDALREHYPARGAIWPGWRDVLPGRTTSAIHARAKAIGTRCAGRGRKPKAAHAPRPATCGECRHYREGDAPGTGSCVERHARAWFGGAPVVEGRYEARLCAYGEART